MWKRAKKWPNAYLWYIFLLSHTDKVFKHGHHWRSSNHMAIDQVRKKTHLKQTRKYEMKNWIPHNLRCLQMTHLPSKQLHCTSCFSVSPWAAWSWPPQTRHQNCSFWHSVGRLMSYTRSAFLVEGVHYKQNKTIYWIYWRNASNIDSIKNLHCA